jgi:HAMP domain-containing protein
MRLQTKLVLLGMSGPLVGLLSFWLISIHASSQFSSKAKQEIAGIINNENERSLKITTTLVQDEAEQVSQNVSSDSGVLIGYVKKIRADKTGKIYINNRPVDTQELNSYLSKYFLPVIKSTDGERAGIFIRKRTGEWQRLATINSAGEIINSNHAPSNQVIAQLDKLLLKTNGSISNLITLTKFDGEWRISKLTSFQPNGSTDTLILDVNIPSSFHSELAAATGNLFPAKVHQVALFQKIPSGDLICSYAKPNNESCSNLLRAMEKSGGIPALRKNGISSILKRTAMIPPIESANSPKSAIQQTLYITVIPEWQIIVAICVDNSYFNASISGISKLRAGILMELTVATVVIMAVIGILSYIIAQRITKQINIIAKAANAMAAGQTKQNIIYGEKDSLGRLVMAFNHMSATLAERETSLIRQINELEININQNDLSCQINEITKHQDFTDLSERAKAMRERRRLA